MEQIKDIFKQVRQAKGSLAFCKDCLLYTSDAADEL